MILTVTGVSEILGCEPERFGGLISKAEFPLKLLLESLRTTRVEGVVFFLPSVGVISSIWPPSKFFCSGSCLITRLPSMPPVPAVILLSSWHEFATLLY